MWGRKENIIVSLEVKWLGNMMNEVDIENLTIEQYLMLTQESQTQGMVRSKSGRMITKDIDDMTIAEYMEYEILENNHYPDKLKTNDYLPSNPPCFKPAQPLTDDMHELLEKEPNDYHLFTPNSHYKTKEVSSDKDVDEWLNEELSKCMTGQDKEEEEDALIDILKTVVEECK
ncbi:hypothetical protein Tco_1558446 [Tanacetum coccineum]